MSKEVTVILKDSERTYRQKFLVYEEFKMNEDDGLIRTCIASAKKNFDGEPEDIQIRCLMVVK